MPQRKLFSNDWTPDWQNNSIGALRLVLASLVILAHAPVLSNNPTWPLVLYAVGPFGLGYIAVLGFFFLSGILITRSWENSSSLKSFLVKRFLRIYPGFWVCLAVTAFVLAPLAVYLKQGSLSGFPWSGPNSALSYVYKDFTLKLGQDPIGGTFGGHAMNFPLWTLISEFGCYLVTAAFGLLGIGRKHRFWLLLLLIACLAVDFYIRAILNNELLFRGRLIHVAAYLLGVVAYYYKEYIPITWKMLVFIVPTYAVSVMTQSTSFLFAPALCYLVYLLAFLGPLRNIEKRGDLSYGIYIYGYPVQQLVAQTGGAALGLGLYTALCFVAVAPVAALSWFLVERPAMSLRKRFPPPSSGTPQP